MLSSDFKRLDYDNIEGVKDDPATVKHVSSLVRKLTESRQKDIVHRVAMGNNNPKYLILQYLDPKLLSIDT
jgi:hypothetical protein